ncbi:MAG: methyltransferase domain-containing protein [Candidatus Rokubacteria bacterium]|nr:methyltransferase domain-containing protein [Candidatus Rokubacteria bacterium]
MSGIRARAIRSIFAARRALNRAAELARYVAVGLMRSDELRTAIATAWTGFMPDERGVPSTELFAWESDVYLRVLKPTDRILLVGCGTGRDLIALLELGYRADGLELVAACAAAARARLAERGLAAVVATGAIETAPLDAVYDVFIFSYWCYSYIPQSATRTHILRRLRERLPPDGRIVIPYIPAPSAVRPILITVARLLGRLTRSGWQPEAGDVFLDGPTAVGLHYQHHFGEDEIEREVRAAGLRIRHHHRAAAPALIVTL